MDEAIAMYQELHRWEDAIAVAEARVRKARKVIRYIILSYSSLPIANFRITLTLQTFAPPTFNGYKSLAKRRWLVR